MSPPNNKVESEGYGSVIDRAALQDMPEISEASKHIMLEETKQGPQYRNCRSGWAFNVPDGAKEKIAPQLKAMPYRLSILAIRRPARCRKPGYGPWELSADRANAMRQILDAEAVPSGNIYIVGG
jgi:chemotaxis protein MotB